MQLRPEALHERFKYVGRERHFMNEKQAFSRTGFPVMNLRALYNCITAKDGFHVIPPVHLLFGLVVSHTKSMNIRQMRPIEI